MVPDKFDMVDMGGIDLILMQGEEVSGLYNRLVESITQCRYQCLYNWLFNGVIIPPTYVELGVNEDDEVTINEGVTVTPDDVIHIYSIERVITPITIEENGTYYVPEGVDGFNPVTVNVLNGTYCKVEILSPISEDVYIVYSESFDFLKYFIDNGYVYKCEIHIDSVEDNFTLNPFDYSVRMGDNKVVQIYENQSYDFSFDGDDLVFTRKPGSNYTTGVIIHCSTDVLIRYHNFSYRQCGRSYLNGVLPDIQNTGAGREYYFSPSNDRDVTIPYVSDRNFFIAGNAYTDQEGTITVKNFVTH